MEARGGWWGPDTEVVAEEDGADVEEELACCVDCVAASTSPWVRGRSSSALRFKLEGDRFSDEKKWAKDEKDVLGDMVETAFLIMLSRPPPPDVGTEEEEGEGPAAATAALRLLLLPLSATDDVTCAPPVAWEGVTVPPDAVRKWWKWEATEEMESLTEAANGAAGLWCWPAVGEREERSSWEEGDVGRGLKRIGLPGSLSAEEEAGLAPLPPGWKKSVGARAERAAENVSRLAFMICVVGVEKCQNHESLFGEEVDLPNCI